MLTSPLAADIHFVKPLKQSRICIPVKITPYGIIFIYFMGIVSCYKLVQSNLEFYISSSHSKLTFAPGAQARYWNICTELQHSCANKPSPVILSRPSIFDFIWQRIKGKCLFHWLHARPSLASQLEADNALTDFCICF